jgi:hypothetical protein
MALLWLAVCRTAQGQLAEAERLVRASIEGGLQSGQSTLAAILARAGKTDEARECVRALDQAASQGHVPRLTLAQAHAAIGEKELSLAFLEQAEQERSAMFTASLLGPGYLTLAQPWMKDWFAARRENVLPPAARAGH